MAAPRAPKTAGDAYTLVGLVAAVPTEWDACERQLPTFAATEFAITGLLLLTAAPLAAGAIATRLKVPLATVTAALARLDAATVCSADPRAWDLG
jgi:hypothetical protein